MTSTSMPDSPSRAIALLLMGVAGGLSLDLCAKELLQSHSLEQFVLLRSAIGVAIFLLIARFFGGLKRLRTTQWRWHLLRTLLASGAMFGFFFGLSQMPLVNALTIAFIAPLIVTALSVPFLGESVGWRRWVAVSIGFCGVLIVLRPGAGMFTPAAIGVLIAAFCYAGLAITARHLGKTESSLALSVYVMVGPMLASAFLSLDQEWVAPDSRGWLLFFSAGACSVVAWVGVIGGYARASPAMLAPFEYTALVGGAVAGYLFWDEVPDRWVITGASIIIASGLYVVYRELGVRIGASVSNRYLRSSTASLTDQERADGLNSDSPSQDKTP